MLRLALPTPADEAEVMAYRREFLERGDLLAGAFCLERCASYADWLQRVTANRSPATVPAGLVPASTMLAWDADRLVGMIDIRHELNDYLLQFGGHIGYSVRPACRRRGYASQMLGLALDECRKLGLPRVLITCDSRNIASERTILRNGGVLENEVPEDGGLTRRYWITLK